MTDKNRNETILITGGCRSGKSRYAESLAKEICNGRKLYVATCVPQDKEMEERVLQHQKSRDKTWETSEIPVHVAGEIDLKSSDYDVILLDCMTLWISNLMMDKNDEEIMAHAEKLVLSLQKSNCPVILVTNELGAGIVPENVVARRFRDIVGSVNQRIAKAADRVVWMVSGIPVTIKQEKRP